MILSISSMSATMPSLKVGSADISTPRRRRASGVRRSCEMPARIRVRLASAVLRSLAIWLKALARARISAAPSSGTLGGPLAAADRARRGAQALQRPVDGPDDEVGADQCQQQGGRAPAQPLLRRVGVDAVAAQPHPVLVVIDVKADPHAGQVVAAGGEARVLAELGAQQFLDAADHRALRQRLHGLFRYRPGRSRCARTRISPPADKRGSPASNSPGRHASD